PPSKNSGSFDRNPSHARLFRSIAVSVPRRVVRRRLGPSLIRPGSQRPGETESRGPGRAGKEVAGGKIASNTGKTRDRPENEADPDQVRPRAGPANADRRGGGAEKAAGRVQEGPGGPRCRDGRRQERRGGVQESRGSPQKGPG